MSGNAHSGRHITTAPGSSAGARLLQWATERVAAGEVKPLVVLAIALGVSPRTVMHWIAGQSEPAAGQAVAMLRITGVAVEGWGEVLRPDNEPSASADAARPEPGAADKPEGDAE